MKRRSLLRACPGSILPAHLPFSPTDPRNPAMAASTIAPQKTVTFTVTKVPHRAAARKTIERLMRLQPQIQKELDRRADLRRQKQNVTRRRGGGMWTSRVRVVKLAHLEPGASFTLRVTSQLLPDIKSVEQYLSSKSA